MAIVAAPNHREVMQQWRRQLGSHAALANARGPRPYAVVSYQVREPAANLTGCELRQVTFMALFDEWNADRQLTTRLIGVRGSLVCGTLAIGGPLQTRFDKDLRAPPATDGRGRRLDAADRDLLSFALQLEGYLERFTRHPYFPRRSKPVLPELFFQDGRPLLDLSRFPKRQVILIDNPATDLCGNVGTSSFDFYHTRFHVAANSGRAIVFSCICPGGIAPMKILFINCDGGGFAAPLDVADQTTVGTLFCEQLPHGKPQDYLIRVNRQPATANQILHEGDRVTITPVKIEGAI